MHVLSRDTVQHIDSWSSTFVDDHWVPKTEESARKRDHLEVLGRDINMLDMYPTSHEAVVPGLENAMDIVLSDIAMKASRIMQEIPKSELVSMRLADPSIALNPIHFDLSEEDKAHERARREETRARSMEFHGAPKPSLYDRGPLSVETADRVAEVTSDLVKSAKWKSGSREGSRITEKVAHLSGQLDRLGRHRAQATDPVVRQAYDVFHGDMALKAAIAVNKAIDNGVLNIRKLESDVVRLMHDPHTASQRHGLIQQAAMAKADAPSAAKGPKIAETPTPARAGPER